MYIQLDNQFQTKKFYSALHFMALHCSRGAVAGWSEEPAIYVADGKRVAAVVRGATASHAGTMPNRGGVTKAGRRTTRDSPAVYAVGCSCIHPHPAFRPPSPRGRGEYSHHGCFGQFRQPTPPGTPPGPGRCSAAPLRPLPGSSARLPARTHGVTSPVPPGRSAPQGAR